MRPNPTTIHFLLLLLQEAIDLHTSQGVAEILSIVTGHSPWAEICVEKLSSFEQALSTPDILKARFVTKSVNNLVLYALDPSDTDMVINLVLSLSPLV